MFEEELKQRAKERKLKSTLAWRKRNWDHCLEVAKRYREKNKERIREKEHTPYRKEYRRNWQQKNKEKLRIYHREYYHRKIKKKDPEEEKIRKMVHKIMIKMEGKA